MDEKQKLTLLMEVDGKLDSMINDCLMNIANRLVTEEKVALLAASWNVKKLISKMYNREEPVEVTSAMKEAVSKPV